MHLSRAARPSGRPGACKRPSERPARLQPCQASPAQDSCPSKASARASSPPPYTPPPPPPQPPVGVPVYEGLRRNAVELDRLLGDLHKLRDQQRAGLVEDDEDGDFVDEFEEGEEDDYGDEDDWVIWRADDVPQQPQQRTLSASAQMRAAMGASDGRSPSSSSSSPAAAQRTSPASAWQQQRSPSPPPPGADGPTARLQQDPQRVREGVTHRSASSMASVDASMDDAAYSPRRSARPGGARPSSPSPSPSRSPGRPTTESTTAGRGQSPSYGRSSLDRGQSPEGSPRGQSPATGRGQSPATGRGHSPAAGRGQGTEATRGRYADAGSAGPRGYSPSPARVPPANLRSVDEHRSSSGGGGRPGTTRVRTPGRAA